MLSADVSATLTKAYDSFSPWLHIPRQYRSLAVCTLGAFSLGLASKRFYQKQVEKHDVAGFVSKLSEQRQDRKLSGTVVICGGSIAGLLTACVCSHHFEKVIIVEPEEWVLTDVGRSAGVQPKRAHVMQYTFLHHCHLILTLALKQLFPDLAEEVAKLGGRLSQTFSSFTIAGMDFLVPASYPFYGPYKVFPPVFTLTRPKFETLLRLLVRKHYPNVEYISGSGAGLVPNKDFKSVDAVSVRRSDGTTVDLPASLVIDCTGPAMSGYRWLKDIPYNNDKYPKLDTLRQTYDHKMHCSTLEFDIPDELIDTIQERAGMPVPFLTGTRLYGYFPIPTVEKGTLDIERREKNLLHIGLGGWENRIRVTNAEGVIEYMKQLQPMKPLPQWVYRLVEIMQEENVPCRVEHLRYPMPVNIQYYKAKYLPSNFIAIGDSLTHLNPLTGQGTAKITGQVIILAMLFSRYQRRDKLPSTFSRDFFQETENRLGYIWESTKGLDYNFKSTVPVAGEKLDGRRTLGSHVSSKLMLLSMVDREISTLSFLLTSSLISPIAACTPWLFGKVILLGLKKLAGLL